MEQSIRYLMTLDSRIGHVYFRRAGVAVKRGLGHLFSDLQEGEDNGSGSPGF